MLTVFAPCSPAWSSATAHNLRASGAGAGGGLGSRVSGLGSRVGGSGLYAAFRCAISSPILSRILLKDEAVHLKG